MAEQNTSSLTDILRDLIEQGIQQRYLQERFTPTEQYTPEGRPVYQSETGWGTTERTATSYIPELGGWINYPTFYHGKLLPDQIARQMVVNSGGVDPITGRRLEVFDTVENAVSAAGKRSGGLGGDTNIPPANMFRPPLQPY